MTNVVFLLIFNLTTGNAVVREEPTMSVCEVEKRQALKTMHLNAKDGARYNALCIDSKTFDAKREKI